MRPRAAGSNSNGVRGTSTPELRQLRALSGVFRRDYAYEQFWVVFPTTGSPTAEYLSAGAGEAELVVRIGNKEGRVSWPVPESVTPRGRSSLNQCLATTSRVERVPPGVCGHEPKTTVLLNGTPRGMLIVSQEAHARRREGARRNDAAPALETHDCGRPSTSRDTAWPARSRSRHTSISSRARNLLRLLRSARDHCDAASSLGAA